MRIITLPLIASADKIQSESDFLVYRNFHRTLKEKLFAYYVLPFRSASKISGIENEKMMFVDRDKSIYTMQTRVPAEMRDFDVVGQKDNDMVAEAILTSRAVSGLSLARYYWRSYFRSQPLPVFIVEPKVIDYESSHNAFVFEELFARSCGYATCYTFFSTEYEKRLAIDQAKRYLAPSMVKRLIQNSWVLPLGINLDEIDLAKREIPKNEKFTLLFSGRANSNKNFEAILELFDNVYRLGYDVRIIMMSPLGLKSGVEEELQKRFPTVELLSNLNREDYLKVLCSSHISMNWSKIEGFSVGLIEQIRSGLMTLVPNKPWVSGLFGEAFNEYPFVFDGGVHAFALIKKAYHDWAGMQDTIKAASKFIDTFEENAVSDKMYDIMDMKTTEFQQDFGMSKGLIELVDQALVGFEESVDFAELITRMENNSRMGKGLFAEGDGRFVMTKFDAYVRLKRLGYKALPQDKIIMVKNKETENDEG